MRDAAENRQGYAPTRVKDTVGTHFIRVRKMQQIPNMNSVTLEYLDYGKTNWTSITISNQRLRYATHGVISIDLHN